MDTSPIHKQVLSALGTVPSVCQAILFGSCASGRERPDSDVDIAVDLGHPLSIQEKIALISAVTTETGRAADVIDLQTVGEPLLGQILANGTRLLGTNTRYAELIKRHLFNEADFMPYQRRILEQRRKKWIAN